MTDSVIWRAVDGNLTQAGASAGNIIKFNEGSVNQNGYIYKSEFEVRISVPENERIAEDLNAVQDMGLDGNKVGVIIQLRYAGDKTGLNTP